MSSDGAHARKLIDELTAIEFDTGSDIQAYTTKVRDLMKAVALELEYGAQELEARLKDLPPAEGEGRIVARRKARSVARHLRRSAEATRTAGIEAVRTWGSLRKHYEHILKPVGKKKTINLSA